MEARALPDLKPIVPAGDFRRGCELISDLSLVMEAPHVSGASHDNPWEPAEIHLTDPASFDARFCCRGHAITIPRAERRGAPLSSRASSLRSAPRPAPP